MFGTPMFYGGPEVWRGRHLKVHDSWGYGGLCVCCVLCMCTVETCVCACVCVFTVGSMCVYVRVCV